MEFLSPVRSGGPEKVLVITEGRTDLLLEAIIGPGPIASQVGSVLLFLR